MKITNPTPFAVMLLPGRDPRGQATWTLIARGSFRFTPGRSELTEAPEPPAVRITEAYHGDRGTSSLLEDSDLVPFKPRSDVIIHAVASAPSGKPAADWLVHARVGSLAKTLRVTGPRRWRRGVFGGYSIEGPEPCRAVPLRYEHAFGGTAEGRDGKRRTFHENPVGAGFAGDAPRAQTIEAPQIEAPDDPIRDLGRAHRPEGLGPIPRAWMPRRARAGTTDEKWRAERCPRPPLDFDEAYFNAARPDMTYDGYLAGDEEVGLVNLSPAGTLAFRLPGYQLGIEVAHEAGGALPCLLRLDTLFIDVPGERVHLTWRARYPRHPRLGDITIHARKGGHDGHRA